MDAKRPFNSFPRFPMPAKKNPKKPTRKPKQLSYSEKRTLCEEYFEHEKKKRELGEYQTRGNGFCFTIYFGDQPKNSSNDVCVDALNKRMNEIKAKVGESVIEMHREMKELKDRVSKLEGVKKDSCDTGRIVLSRKPNKRRQTFRDRLNELISKNKGKCCICGDDC